MSDTSSFGYGQQTPNDSADDFNSIAFLVRQFIAQMDTMKLVQVMAVHSNGALAAAGTVDVMPLVNQLDGNGNPTPHGTVFGIPWFRLQGGLNAIICDPQVNDVGHVVCSDRDISNVKSTKKQANPGSLRKYDIADGVYVGGVLMPAPTAYIAFLPTGIKIVDANGNSAVMSATGIVLTPASGQPVTVEGNLIVSGNLQLGGTLEAVAGGTYAAAIKTTGNVIAGFGTGDSVGLMTHTHTQPNDSHNDAEQPTSAPTAGT